jgi:fructuronate reductase
LHAELPRLRRPKAPDHKPGIVHLGPGAFFRGFGAVYVEDAVRASGGDWGIIGVSLQSPNVRDLLAPQDHVYQVVTLNPDGSRSAREIESLQDVLVAPEEPEAVLDLLTDPAIRIVTLTITEKGYCHDPATGRLNLAHPGIAHDLAHDLPQTAPGYLVRALQRRHAAGHPPFTVLTCDNLPSNGRLVRGILLDFARELDPQLADWIASEGRFPSTMVDRITPATTPEDIETLAGETGQIDRAPVICEPFRQWVIEDDFVPAYGPDARPDLASSGVEIVDDVEPFEHMKLRMLNGTHSALAYLGYLAGRETIADTVADPNFANYVRMLWRDEIIPSFEAPPGVDLDAYASALLARYQNPAIRHRTWQIAMDGSQKLPQRILGTVQDNLDQGRECPGLITAVAAWMIYVGGTDLNGNEIDVRDPMADRLKTLSARGETCEEKVTALLGVADIFDPDLAERIRGPLTAAYTRLRGQGVAASIEALS